MTLTRQGARGCAGAAWTALLGVGALTLTSLAAAHLALDDRQMAAAAIHAGIGWWLLPAAPLAAVALASGRRRIASAAAGVALLHLGLVAPGHRLGPLGAERSEETVRIGSANLLSANPRPRREIDALLALDADLWCLQELSGEYARLLSQGEPARRWPHRWLVPDDQSSFGIGFVSRLPLDRAWTEDLLGVPMAAAVLGGGGPGAGVVVLCVHTVPPRTPHYTGEWAAQMDALARRVEAIDGPVIVAGDLNATRHHPAYRRLLAAGLHDAHAEVGRASAWTWPAPPYWDLLPRLRLDHVLLSETLAAHGAEEGTAGGSDHRPIAVEVGPAALFLGGS